MRKASLLFAGAALAATTTAQAGETINLRQTRMIVTGDARLPAGLNMRQKRKTLVYGSLCTADSRHPVKMITTAKTRRKVHALCNKGAGAVIQRNLYHGTSKVALGRSIKDMLHQAVLISSGTCTVQEQQLKIIEFRLALSALERRYIKVVSEYDTDMVRRINTSIKQAFSHGVLISKARHGKKHVLAL